MRDPAQGHCYAVSHAKDVATGWFAHRLRAYASSPKRALMLGSGSFHFDAYRDTDGVSWEADGSFIAQDEEMEVGIKGQVAELESGCVCHQ